MVSLSLPLLPKEEFTHWNKQTVMLILNFLHQWTRKWSAANQLVIIFSLLRDSLFYWYLAFQILACHLLSSSFTTVKLLWKWNDRGWFLHPVFVSCVTTSIICASLMPLFLIWSIFPSASKGIRKALETENMKSNEKEWERDYFKYFYPSVHKISENKKNCTSW